MPLPKGIYSNPDVRRAWIEERQPILDRYDALVAGGTTTREAARQVGSTRTGIRGMRESLASLAGRTTGRAKGARIDLGLALLSIANPPGPERQAFSAEDIAAWCECTRSAIQSIERRALRKLHRRFNALLREQVICGEFGREDTFLPPAPRLAVAA